MEDRENLLRKIIEIEFNMLAAVPAESPASCQSDPQGFRIMREAQFESWSEDTLQSYLKDLSNARDKGRNLMTLKYARMDGRIPPLKDNKRIEEITDMQVDWQKEMARKYPALISRGRPVEEDQPGVTSFKTYIRSELETLSNETLELLASDMRRKLENGENPARGVYNKMVSMLGYDSLEEAEKQAMKEET